MARLAAVFRIDQHGAAHRSNSRQCRYRHNWGRRQLQPQVWTAGRVVTRIPNAVQSSFPRRMILREPGQPFLKTVARRRDTWLDIPSGCMQGNTKRKAVNRTG